VESVYPILFLVFKALFVLGALGCALVIPVTAADWVRVILKEDTEEEMRAPAAREHQF
jgi:hypothetical protein